MAASPLPNTTEVTVGKLILKLKKLVNWQDFAYQLPEIETADVETIEYNHPNDNGGQKRALYECWLRKYPEASWKDVTDALKKNDENKIAEKISPHPASKGIILLIL